jgi:hypothetical protein
MSVTTHEAETRTAMPGSMLRALLHAVRAAVEAHAEHRVKSAVAPTKLRQADREMRRYRHLMQAGK